MALSTRASEDDILTIHRIRRLRLDSDQRVLCELEGQVDALTLETCTIQAKLAELEAALEVSQRSLEAARARHSALLADVREQCAALLAIEHFPEELLAVIFAHYAFDGAHDWSNGPVTSNRGRARAPFICAAVCRRWRRAAISHPALWHYVAVPQLTQATSDGARFAAYVDVALKRSGSVPLVVIFDMIDHASSRHHSKLLDMLSPELHRWQYFSAMLAEQRALSTFLECLRGPALSLVAVCVGVRPGEACQLVPFDPPPPQARPRYLCHAPKLDCLWIENLPFSWRRGHETMRALTRLVLIQRLLGESFWHTLETAAPALEHLVVHAKDIPPAGHVSPVHLPKLASLEVGAAAWKSLERFPAALDAPVLRVLNVSGGRPREVEPFLSRIAASLTGLTLRVVAIVEDDIAPLRRLAALERLTLSSCTVTTALFERLCDDSRTTPGMWTALAELELDGVTLKPACGDALVELVRTRVRDEEQVQGGRTRVHVAFGGDHNIPRWDVAEIDHILGRS